MIILKKVNIRKADLTDLDDIKSLVDKEKDTFGFITKGTLQVAIDKQEIIVAEYQGKIIGFQHYHHRKTDRQTTLYNKVVDKEFRRMGVGTKLVDALKQESIDLNRDFLFLKCPVDEKANLFHQSYGFKLTGTEKGKKRKLNIYKYDL